MEICLSLEDAMNLKITSYREILSYTRNMQCAQLVGGRKKNQNRPNTSPPPL